VEEDGGGTRQMMNEQYPFAFFSLKGEDVGEGHDSSESYHFTLTTAVPRPMTRGNYAKWTLD
jgi:hypothetical protein